MKNKIPDYRSVELNEKNFDFWKLKFPDRFKNFKKNIFKKIRYLIWVTTDNKNLVGTMSIAHSDYYNAETFCDFQIDPEYRGLGLSHELLDYAMKKYKDVKHLEVKQDNTIAINLYKNHGFKIIDKYKLDGEKFYSMIKRS